MVSFPFERLGFVLRDHADGLSGVLACRIRHGGQGPRASQPSAPDGDGATGAILALFLVGTSCVHLDLGARIPLVGQLVFRHHLEGGGKLIVVGELGNLGHIFGELLEDVAACFWDDECCVELDNEPTGNTSEGGGLLQVACW